MTFERGSRGLGHLAAIWMVTLFIYCLKTTESIYVQKLRFSKIDFIEYSLFREKGAAQLPDSLL